MPKHSGLYLNSLVQHLILYRSPVIESNLDIRNHACDHLIAQFDPFHSLCSEYFKIYKLMSFRYRHHIYPVSQYIHRLQGERISQMIIEYLYVRNILMYKGNLHLIASVRVLSFVYHVIIIPIIPSIGFIWIHIHPHYRSQSLTTNI